MNEYNRQALESYIACIDKYKDLIKIKLIKSWYLSIIICIICLLLSVYYLCILLRNLNLHHNFTPLHAIYDSNAW